MSRTQLEERIAVNTSTPLVSVLRRQSETSLWSTLSLEGEFRILRLLPGEKDDIIAFRLETASLTLSKHSKSEQTKEIPEYEAVSYTWGTSAPDAEILMNDIPMYVTSNLHDALRRIRYPDRERTLWIDQLCINQWNMAEKASQVEMMREIYKSCTRCLIWLGEFNPKLQVEPKDVEELFKYWRSLEKLDDNSEELSMWKFGPEGDGVRRAITEFMTNPWWRRAWTVQEAALPAKALVIWGQHNIELETMRVAGRRLCNPEVDKRISAFLPPREFVGIHSPFTTSVVGLDCSMTENESKLEILHRWRYREATDPRDKVYALAGLMQNNTDSETDGNDSSGSSEEKEEKEETVVEEVEMKKSKDKRLPYAWEDCSYTIDVAKLYANVTVDLIREKKDLQPLIAGQESHFTPGLPTWAYDLDYKRQLTPLGGWERMIGYWCYSATKSTVARLEYFPDEGLITLKGFMLDTISDVNGGLEEDFWVNKGSWPDTTNEKLFEKFKEWRHTLNCWKEKHESGEDYIRGGSIDNAFAKTIIGEVITGYEFADKYASDEDYNRLEKYLNDGDFSSEEINVAVRFSATGHSFFITEKGYLGTGYQNIKPGDQVWIFYGSNMPFVLRPQGTRFTFVREAYVYGIMHGELLDEFSPEEAEKVEII